MSIIWIIVISYALINLIAGTFETIQVRKEIYTATEQKFDEVVEKHDLNWNKGVTVKWWLVSGLILTLVYDTLIWAPHKLVKIIIELREE